VLELVILIEIRTLELFSRPVGSKDRWARQTVFMFARETESLGVAGCSFVDGDRSLDNVESYVMGAANLAYRSSHGRPVVLE
jgi:hypothetical protein